MKRSQLQPRDETQKKFMEQFDSICGKHSPYQVWQDFVTVTAIAISNTVDKGHFDQREETYHSITKRYNKKELDSLSTMFALTVTALEENRKQDFLGDLCGRLNLLDAGKGQFFTPYHVCEFMAKVTGGDLKAQIEKQHWVSVSDPCCGAGSLLIAFANHCLGEGVNYQQSCLFVGQDIDPTVAAMCYIQLSLLGCPGYVIVGNSITEPGASYDDRGLFPVNSENIWYTPMFFHETWEMRRTFALLDELFKKTEVQEEPTTAPEECIILPSPETVELLATESGQLALF